MTRPFRLEEDERRYFALRSEFFIRLVQSGVPAQTVHEIMRNFGKLEDAMFFEGVSQGMVAALFVDLDQNDLPALSVHADTYEAASTPLSRVEDEVVAQPGYAHLAGHAWLSKEPMRWGPLTLTEAVELYGPDLVVKRAAVREREAVQDTRTNDQKYVDALRGTVDLETGKPAYGGPDAEDPMAILDELAKGDDPASVFARRGLALPDVDMEQELQDLEEAPAVSEDADRPIHSPQLLDRARDVLLRSTAPKDWTELVLLLMRELRVDAGHIDEMMSTPMGMTVISQCNLFHLHPGAFPEVKAVPPPTR